MNSIDRMYSLTLPNRLLPFEDSLARLLERFSQDEADEADEADEDQNIIYDMAVEFWRDRNLSDKVIAAFGIDKAMDYYLEEMLIGPVTSSFCLLWAIFVCIFVER